MYKNSLASFHTQANTKKAATCTSRHKAPRIISKPPIAALTVSNGTPTPPKPSLIKLQQMLFGHDESKTPMANEHAGHDTTEDQLRGLRSGNGEARHFSYDGEPGGAAGANAMHPK